MTSRKQS